MTRRGLGTLTAALILAGTTACGGTATPARPSTNWAPAARQVDGLTTLAQSDAAGFRLHTRSGDKTFLPGVNLGSSTPLHQPGEVGTIPGSDYRRWLGEMGSLGIRVVRVYTLLPPAFYDELARYDEAHPKTPIYLVQGVYLPDESYNEPSKTLYTPAIDDAFTREIADISGAVHGDLTRPEAPGRAGGSYRTDVSKWLVSWIIGVEWDPPGVVHTNRVEAHHPYTPGKYFAATADASPTERWIATHMDETARLEAKYGDSMPIAFANWPTTDPLRHPDEPLRGQEDLVGVDANHVLPTRAWPGGTFASFHAYPYYPDFQRYEPALAKTRWRGRADRYAGYLMSLKAHFAGHMPLLVSEFGVPGSLGSAHSGTNGRDQGDHSEQEEMAMDADMMRMMQAKGVAGAFVFAWSDEWFKRTWNTEAHQDPTRRQLWHDPLTNEQWFGLLATDAEDIPDVATEVLPQALPPNGALKYLYTWGDASWVHIEVTTRHAAARTLAVAVDTIPSLPGPDYRIQVDTATHTARLLVRRELDPIRLDNPVAAYRPGYRAPWHLYELITNRPYLHFRLGAKPAEYLPVGNLREGSWDPKGAHYDSLATWHVDTAHDTVRLRIPWAMLGLADPSSHLALGPGTPASMVKIAGLPMTITADGQTAKMDFTWSDWNNAPYTERLKAGSGVLAKAYADLAP